MNKKYNLTEEQIETYHNDGFLVIPKFFNDEEVARLYSISLEDETMRKNSIDLNDKEGKKTKLSLWFTPGNDIYGLLTKSERIVNTVDKLMDGRSPVCHFHSKLMQKEPKQGGAWEWHQDYGYWYKNEFLFPDQMISVMVAITQATKENGCLQVIKGSHKLGRVEHGIVGEQTGASQRYVDLALKTMELIYVELNPGDTLFFHSNILHRSEANLSDNSRWSLISVYNRQQNVPYNEKSTSCLVPLEIVPNDSLLLADTDGLREDVDFLILKQDSIAK